MLDARVAGWTVWLALVMVAPSAFAHAVVTKTSLEATPVRAGAPASVTLQLNSAIERAFTRVTLVDAAGAATPLEVADDAKPGAVVVRLPALSAGRYGLRYRVLAADGHVTENIIRFQVEP